MLEIFDYWLNRNGIEAMVMIGVLFTNLSSHKGLLYALFSFEGIRHNLSSKGGMLCTPLGDMVLLGVHV